MQDYYESLPTPTGATSAVDIIAGRIVTRQDCAMFHVQGGTDAGGNLYWAYVELIGNSTILRAFVTTGYPVHTTTPLPSVGLPGIDKADSARMWIAGSNLCVMFSSHAAVAGARDNSVHYAEIPGVVRVPYPQGVAPEGGAFDGRGLGSDPVPTPTPGPAAFTLDDLIARLVMELRSPVPTGTGKTIQKLAQNGATDALAGHSVPAYLATPDALLQVLRDGLYQWTLDRLYQVLHDNGLIPPTP